MLLDTHAFLWFVLDDPRLSAPALAVIGDPNHEVWISPASYWEIAIKISIGKYALQEPFEPFMDRVIADNQLAVLPVEPRHTALLTTLPFHHRDPFDRLLVAQALAENVPLVSGDVILDAYPITRLW